MTTLEVLEAARELISDEKRWTQGEYALDINDEPLRLARVREGCKFCATGALQKVGGTETSPAWNALLDVMGMMPHVFNDTHTHPEVVAAFDKAIAKLKEAA